MVEALEGNNNYPSVAKPHIAIEVKESWQGSLKMKLESSFIPRRREKPRSIFRVPPILRDWDTEAYEPKMVSLGPYHHGKENLKEMESRKFRMAHRLFSYSGDPDAMVTCFRKVMELEESARSCYADMINMDIHEFAEMMVLDGCFIIGFLLLVGGYKQVWVEKDEEEREMVVMYNFPLILEDLIKLENQIPFFILDALYRLLVPKTDIDLSLSDLAVFFLRGIDPVVSDRSICINTDNCEPHHLLHLFHQILSPGDNSDRDYSPIDDISMHIYDHNTVDVKSVRVDPWINDIDDVRDMNLSSSRVLAKQEQNDSNWILSAMKLKRAGLRFVGKNKRSSMDVSFKDGVIEISTLSISGRTVPILRNLIAFEQCYPFTNNHVTFFADLMDRLIKTSRDVSILEEAGILRIGLNSHEEVAYFFHRLCMNVYYNNGKNYLRNVYNNVNSYCDLRSHRWKALMLREYSVYFKHSWKLVSVVAATILLVLTLLQTLYSMLSCYK